MPQKPSSINIIWLALVLIATVTAAYTGKMAEVTRASFDSAKSAVTLAIGLIGPMALWLGIMKVAEEGGLLRIIARAVRPLMVRLFPDVPPEHPAMSAMIMNMAANALGLGNAATPMGIKAMQELEKLAPEKGTATNAMCLFLAINTSSVTLLPLGVITVRAAAGAADASAILIPSLFATFCSTCVAICAAKLLAGRQGVLNPAEPDHSRQDKEEVTAEPVLLKPGLGGKTFVWLLVLAFGAGIIYRFTCPTAPALTIKDFSNWLIPVLICLLLVFGYFRGVKIYETLTDGAKEGQELGEGEAEEGHRTNPPRRKMFKTSSSKGWRVSARKRGTCFLTQNSASSWQ